CASLIDAHVHPCNCAEVSAPCGAADENTVSDLNTRAIDWKRNDALDPKTGDRPHRFGGNHGPRRDCLSRMQVRILHPETAELLVDHAHGCHPLAPGIAGPTGNDGA